MEFFRRIKFASPWQLIRFFLPLTGVLPLIVYCLTVYPCAYPGLSASLTAAAARLCQTDDLSSPIFMLVSHGVASLHYGTLPLRLNLFCAVCGAIAVSLFYLIVARLVFMLASEGPDGSTAAWQINATDGDNDSSIRPSSKNNAQSKKADDSSRLLSVYVQEHNLSVSSAAILGGIGAAVTLAFSAPFWLASTHFYPHTFDLMLFFFIVNLLLDYDQMERPVSLFLGAFFLAVCSVESPLFLILLPLGLVFVFYDLVQNEQMSTAKVLGVLLVVVSGVVLAMSLLWLAATQCNAIAAPATRPIMNAFVTTQLSEVSKWIPGRGWSYIFVQLFFPLVIAPFVFMFSFRRSTSLLFILQLMLVACIVPSLLNLNISLWGIARQTARIPIFSHVLIALFTGLIISVWHLKRESTREKTDDEPDCYEYGDNPTVCRLGAWLCWPLLFLTLVVPFRSFDDIDPHKGQFVDVVADKIYAELGSRDWLVNCSFFKHSLMIRANKDGRTLHFISSDSATNRYETACLNEYIQKQTSLSPYRYRLLNAADLSTSAFIKEWLRNETNSYQRIALFREPSIWSDNGFSPVAAGFFLCGQPKDTPIDTAALVAQHKALLGALKSELYPAAPDTSRLLSDYRDVLRRQLALMANEIGVLLVRNHRTNQASELFTQSESLDANNLSILLNRYCLAKDFKVQATSLAEIETKLKTVLQRHNSTDLNPETKPLEIGTLINPETLDYARKTLGDKANPYRNLGISATAIPSDPLTVLRAQKRALHQSTVQDIDENNFAEADRQLNMILALDGKDTFALANKALVAIEQHNPAEARRWMALAKENGIKPTELVWHEASLLLMNGDLDTARAMMNTAIPADPANVRLWGLLADILLRLGEYHELETRVYPALRNAAVKKDNYILHKVRGYLCKNNGVREYASARAAFLHALELNDKLSDLNEEILRIDDILDVPAFSEQDAKAVLRKNPEHAFANYLLGQVRLRRGELDKAEDLFRRSLENERNAPAYAGLGAVKLAQGDTAAAEKLVRRALELDPKRISARHTLAETLLAEDRTREASDALDSVLKEWPDNLYAQLTLIRLRMKQKKLDEAAALISDLLGNKDRLPPTITQQLLRLAKQLSAEISKR